MASVDEPAVLATVDAALAGDRDALSRLCQISERWIVSIVHRFRFRGADADDVVQEVYAHLIVALPKFDRRSKFSTWVYRVANNAVIVHLRRFKLRARRQLDEESAPEALMRTPAHEEPEQLLLDKLDVLALRSAIEDVDLEDATLNQFDRFYGDDEPLASIAKSHGLSEAALRKRMFTARRKLQERLGRRP